jgi:hypothetical protein
VLWHTFFGVSVFVCVYICALSVLLDSSVADCDDSTMGHCEGSRASCVHGGGEPEHHVCPLIIVHRIESESCLKSFSHPLQAASVALDVPYTSNSSLSLDPNHRLFLLVDDGRVNSFGGEIAFRALLEKTIAEVNNIPIVMIVIQGGPGMHACARALSLF